MRLGSGMEAERNFWDTVYTHLSYGDVVNIMAIVVMSVAAVSLYLVDRWRSGRCRTTDET